MRLLCLNIAAAQWKEQLYQYIAAEAQRTQIFCFQEVTESPAASTEFKDCRIHSFSEVAKLLPGWHAVYDPAQDGFLLNQKTDVPVSYGQALYVAPGLEVVSVSSVESYPGAPDADQPGIINRRGIFQVSRIQHETGEFTVINVHGLAYPGHKLDTTERLEQFNRLNKLVKSQTGPVIVCGDLNLFPNTESLQLARGALRDLIAEYRVATTRNFNTWRNHMDDRQFMSDYMFVTPDIRVNSFEVPYNEVSDHLPLIVDFTLL